MDPADVEDIEDDDGAADDGAADDDLGEGDAGGAHSRTFRCDGHTLGRDARGEPFPTRASFAAPAAPDGRPVVFMPTDVEETNEYVRGVPVYTLRLYGALEGGAKVSVTLTDIHVFFDVCAFADGGRPPAEAALRRALTDAGVLGVRIATVRAFADRGAAARAGRQPFWRVTTDNLQQRRAAIEAARAAGFETKSDDRSSYYRKAARELGLPLSGWAELRDYGVEAPTDHCIALRAPAAACRPAPAAARVDRTLVLAWDIETYSDRKLGDLPVAAHDGDRAFMICVSAHWAGEAAPLLQVCLVDVAARPDPRWLTVECGDDVGVMRAFALCWRALAPDVVAGFNDSAYDWPFIVEKARRHRTLAWMWNQMSAAPRPRATDDTVYEWSYQRDKKIKITAEEVFVSSYLRVPGAVAVDVRVCFKKLYPKAETGLNGSLKFYLAASGLAGKADMPIKLMWRHYEAALAARGAPGAAEAERMRHAAHYCVVDAARCQALLVRRNVLGDLRGVADLAFVSLADAHYYAGGLKVCNLLAAHAWRRDILVGMATREGAEAGKYPGAYVFPPEKGLIPDPARAAAVEAAVLGGGDAAAAFAATAADRPVVGLDFASLYPSLIMAYNLSPEKIVTDPAEAARLRAAGEELHAIESEFNGRPVRGWSVRHGGRPDDIGLFPAVLIDLFARRRAEKAVLARHAAVKELAEGVFGRARADGRGEDAALADMLAEALAEARAGDERQRRAADALAGYADAAARASTGPARTRARGRSRCT